jgi:predicted MFS family arabinose efflux permease
VLQLYWTERFDVGTGTVGILLMLHRVAMGVPLFFVGLAIKRRLKESFIIFLVLEGIALCVTVFVPSFLPAALIWLIHDLFGAGIWLPVQSALIQRFSREQSRGRDLSLVFAVQSLGWIFGPVIAGSVFRHWLGGPYFLSGVLIILAGLVLLPLPGDDRKAAASNSSDIEAGARSG